MCPAGAPAVRAGWCPEVSTQIADRTSRTVTGPTSKATLGGFILLTKLKIQDGNGVFYIKDETKISVS